MEQVIQKAGMEKALLDPPLLVPKPIRNDQGRIQEVEIIPASPTIHRYLLSLNKLLNPWNHPWFITSALYGYNVEAAFLKLIDLIVYRKKHGTLSPEAYCGEAPVATELSWKLPKEDDSDNSEIDSFLGELDEEEEEKES